MLSVLRPSLDAISSERITELIIKTYKEKILTMNRSLCDSRQDHNGLSDLFGSVVRSGLYKKKGKWSRDQGQVLYYNQGK